MNGHLYEKECFIINTQKYELNKWLIPKRSTVNIKTNNGSRNQLEIKKIDLAVSILKVKTI